LADADIADRIWARDAALLRDTVREAGALALSLFRTELKNWTKGASSPVSEADIAVNDLVERGCARRRRIMAGCRKRASTTIPVSARNWSWIVDPIDGTRAYLAGREDWCVSVALVAGSAPVLAAVFAPSSDEFFFACRGQGTTRNERPVPATGGTELDFPRMAGRSRWCNG
jgi:myo-inositol-1(or 4)-monophosphatase